MTDIEHACAIEETGGLLDPANRRGTATRYIGRCTCGHQVNAPTWARAADALLEHKDQQQEESELCGVARRWSDENWGLRRRLQVLAKPILHGVRKLSAYRSEDGINDAHNHRHPSEEAQ
jgi:hypothetical protein